MVPSNMAAEVLMGEGSNHWNIIKIRFYNPENPLKVVLFMIQFILALSYGAIQYGRWGADGWRIKADLKKTNFGIKGHI